jgi:Predicted acetyltransferase
MDITHKEDGSHGSYLATVNGATAQMTYSRTSPKLIILDHTEVPDALRGQGVGQALAAHAVEAAREGGWKIIPLCPFFLSQVKRHPEWRDVISD